MALFKKKTKAQPKNKFQKEGIYMPIKNKPLTKRKKPKKNIIKEIKNNRGRRKGVSLPFKKIFSILLIVFFVGIVSYLSIVYIINLRKTGKTIFYVEENIIGLENIPAYPNSTFIFQDNMDNDYVTNFISTGNSAYRLPSGKNIQDVFEYYQEKLPANGWTYIQTVEVGAEDKKSGQYWTRNNIGLRIYNKYNDVWYETISQKDAEEGLHARIEEEAARDLLLAGDDTQEMLPDFAFIAQIPNEYTISYGASGIGSIKYASLKKMADTEEIIITPVAKYNGEALDTFLYTYMGKLQSKNTDEANNKIEDCVLSTTDLLYANNITELTGAITCTVSGTHLVTSLIDTVSNYGYVIDCNKIDSTFYSTLLANIKLHTTSY